MKLNTIQPSQKRKKPMRVGRGMASGKGKTAGRGMKGQKSRSGVSIKAFEGGQMPIHMRLPKRGFRNIFKKRYAVINCNTLQEALDSGKISADTPITAEYLQSRGVIKHIYQGVRLLGKGELKAKFTCQISGFSAAAEKIITQAGGTIVKVDKIQRVKKESSTSSQDPRKMKKAKTASKPKKTAGKKVSAKQDTTNS